MKFGIIIVVLTTFATTAHAAPAAGLEVCNDNSCSGWVIGYSDDDDSYTINSGPTGGNACNNSTNVGFALFGSNNMCNSSANCESCDVSVPKKYLIIDDPLAPEDSEDPADSEDS